MTQLYALTGKLAELQAMADTDDEGLKEALQHAMDEVQGDFNDKADNIVMLRRNIESDVTAIDNEIERLAELKRIKSNSMSQISDYLRRNMEAANIKSIKRPLFTITLAMGSRAAPHCAASSPSRRSCASHQSSACSASKADQPSWSWTGRISNAGALPRGSPCSSSSSVSLRM